MEHLHNHSHGHPHAAETNKSNATTFLIGISLNTTFVLASDGRHRLQFKRVCAVSTLPVDTPDRKSERATLSFVQ